jgi:hypothetical protein
MLPDGCLLFLWPGAMNHDGDVLRAVQFFYPSLLIRGVLLVVSGADGKIVWARPDDVMRFFVAPYLPNSSWVMSLSKWVANESAGSPP